MRIKGHNSFPNYYRASLRIAPSITGPSIIKFSSAKVVAMTHGTKAMITVSLCLLATILLSVIILLIWTKSKVYRKQWGTKVGKSTKRKSKHRIAYDEDDSDENMDIKIFDEKKYYPLHLGGKDSLRKNSLESPTSLKEYQAINSDMNYKGAEKGKEHLAGKSKKIRIDWYKVKKPDAGFKNGLSKHHNSGLKTIKSKRAKYNNMDAEPRLSIKSFKDGDLKCQDSAATPLISSGSATIGGLLVGIGYGIGGGGSYLHQFFPAQSKELNDNVINDLTKGSLEKETPLKEVKSLKSNSLKLAKAFLPTHFQRKNLAPEPHLEDSHSHSQEEMLLSRKGENGTSPSLPNSPLSKPPASQNTGKQTPTGQQAKSLAEATRLNELYNSGAGEEEDHINLGTIHFGISYDFQNQNLVVKILQAKTLPAKDITGTSDPYVKLFLLPDRKSKMETRVKKKCLNPIWNETFLYEGFPYHKLQNRILNLQVYDYDRFSKDDPIGEIFLPLNEVDLSQFPHYWKKLIPMDKASKTGEILLTLTYVPGPGKLNIEIVKCKNLKPTDVIGSSDPYIKLWLMENGKKIEKQKTQIKFNNLNPIYQESFTFMVSTEKIRSTSILVSALDYDRFTRNDTIGSFLLSSRSSPMEMKHWKDMLLNPGKPITQWHFLRT